MFRRAAALLDFAPADGQRSSCAAGSRVYEPRGELQFVVEAMQRGRRRRAVRAVPAPEGAARGRRTVRRRRASGRCRRFPRAIGVVTSLGGAALHDVLTTLARRAPHVGVVVYPSPVQGADAPAALCAAIALRGPRARGRRADRLPRRRLARGPVGLQRRARRARDRARRRMPVVCGVGHETDVTLADFAADLRAPTPTAAAELVAPATRRRSWQALDALARALRAAHARRRSRREAQRLDRLALRLARPGDALARTRPRARPARAAPRRGAGARAGAARGAPRSTAGARCATPLRSARCAAPRRPARVAAIAPAGARPAAGCWRAATRCCVDARRPRRSRRSAQLRAGPGVRARAGRRSAPTLEVTAVRQPAPRDERAARACRMPREQAAYNRPQTHHCPKGTPWNTRCPRCRTPIDALAPHLSQETLEYHHGKHHKAYVDNLNNLQKGTEFEIDVARGHRQEVLRRHLQQRRPDLEPHLLLELHEAGRRRRAEGRAGRGDQARSGAATPRSRKPSRRARSATSARAGPGW